MSYAFSSRNLAKHDAKFKERTSGSSPGTRTSSVAGSNPDSRRSSIADSSSVGAPPPVPATAASAFDSADYRNVPQTYPGVVTSPVRSETKPAAVTSSPAVSVRPVTVQIAGTSNISSPDDQIRKTILELQARHAEEMQRINSETESRIEALQVQLQNAAEGHQTTQNYARQLYSKLEETATEKESFKTAFAELEKRLALAEGNCEDLAQRLRAETEKNAVLEESIEGARASALSRAASPAPPPVPAGPPSVIAENQALHEENKTLRAELVLKDNTIRQLETRLQEKDSFLVVRLKDGVNNGVVVFHGEGDKNVSQPKDVNITFGAADGVNQVMKDDVVSRKSEATAASFDPERELVQLPIIDDPVLLKDVKDALMDNSKPSGLFVSRLIALSEFDEILPQLIMDLSFGDVLPFKRPGQEFYTDLVKSFVSDIKNIQLNPAVFSEQDLHNFAGKQVSDYPYLTFIPLGVPSKHVNVFVDTELDPNHAPVLFHDCFVEQYLAWNTETSNKLRGLLSKEKPAHMSAAVSDVSAGFEDNSSTSSDSASSADPSSGTAKRSRWLGLF